MSDTALPLLYEHPLSSYAQKVKIVLREKRVAFRCEVPDSFGTPRRDDAFAAASPRHEVPALVIDGEHLFDSTIIASSPRTAGPSRRCCPARRSPARARE